MYTSEENQRCECYACTLRRTPARFAGVMAAEREKALDQQLRMLIHMMAVHLLESPKFYDDHEFWHHYGAYSDATGIDILERLKGFRIDPKLRGETGGAALPPVRKALLELARSGWCDADFEVKDGENVVVEVTLLDRILSISKALECQLPPQSRRHRYH